MKVKITYLVEYEEELEVDNKEQLKEIVNALPLTSKVNKVLVQRIDDIETGERIWLTHD